MNKNSIRVLTGLAIVALGFVGYSTRGQWLSGAPQQVAEPSTAKVAEPEAPPSQTASSEQPAAPAQTAAAEPSVAETPAAPATQADPATQQQAAQQPATESAAPEAPVVAAPAETPVAQPEQQTAAAEPAPAAAPEAQPEQQTAAAEPAQTEQAAAPAEPAASEPQTASESEAAQPAEQQTVAAEAAQPEASPPAPAAEPAAPAEQQAAVQPDASSAEPVPQAAPEQAPSFDTVRVEKSGEAVIAGTAEAGSEVVVKFDGEAIGSTTANDDGAFVLVPENPLPAGSGELTIESKGKGDLAATPSEQSVAVIVPAGAEDGALVAMMSPDAPTKVLQSPEAKDEPEVAAAPQTPAEPEAAVAPAQPAAEAEPAPQPEGQPETQVAAAPQPETQAQPAPAQPAAASPRRVSIDAVDYDSTGNIVFSGQGTPGLTARIYVDNKYVGDAVIGAEGRWTFSGTANVTPGVHSLRVDGLDAGGKVASRIEVPFFREDQTKVAAVQTDTPPAEAPATAAPAEVPQAKPPAVAAEAPAEPAPAAQASAPAEQPAAAAPAAASDVPAKQDQEVAAAAQPEQQAAAPAKPREGRVVIQPGNNLWRISRVLYGSGEKYTMLYKANKDQIRNPNLIYPGQIFKTPEVAPMVETIDPDRRDPLKPEENAAAAP